MPVLKSPRKEYDKIETFLDARFDVLAAADPGCPDADALVRVEAAEAAVAINDPCKKCRRLNDFMIASLWLMVACLAHDLWATPHIVMLRTTAVNAGAKERMTGLASTISVRP
jgi:hypothetical protein